MDVGGWLRSLGLSQYETLFRQNDIDAEVLSELTDGDLEKFGVSFGHRKRLLKAIASLGSTETAAKLANPVPLQTFPEAAERRQLTVMFCDLVGSTALSARLDPEDVREIVGAYHHCCADLIAKAGGFVAKYMGDGVLAYFGYPQAHEHDAERAVHAGLALVEAVPKLKTAAGVPLQVRVGIATGVVVVGDLIGSGAAQEQAVVGETPNLAARLQVLAEPNMVVIAEGTRRLLGDLFELEDLGAKDVKGIAGMVRAWAALRASSVESRFDALHTTGLTALVGREEEFGVAAAALVQRKDGSRPGGVALRRGRHRQIAAHGGASRTSRRRAAHEAALFLLAATHGQRILSHHWPDGARRWIEPPRCAASQARQARRGARADLDLDARRGALCRDAFPRE